MNVTALQNSPFLQSLGWAIANSLWQAAAIWIAYYIITGAYKSASAKFKNTLSTILLSITFVWFCITLINKFSEEETYRENLSGQFVSQPNASSHAINWDVIFTKMAAVLPYLSVAYLLLLILLSLRLINIYRFTRFIKINGLQKPDAEWRLFATKVATHMGITKKIKLWVSHHIDVPATIGFIKPVILIPIASVNKLSADQLEAIILHELSHIKRNDYLINLFISIFETVLFFNPFVVLLSRILKRERENCCDDFVIQYQYDRHTYASALLCLEQSRNLNLKLAIGATSGKKQLLQRIKRIMEINNNTNFNYGQKLAALILITGVICSVAWLAPGNRENKKQDAIKYTNTVNSQQKQAKTKTAFFTIAGDNKEIKFTITKPEQKKAFIPPARIKDANALNQTAIAERENIRLQILLQESKREIERKKISINPAKLFPGNGVFNFSSILDNVQQKAMNNAFADLNEKLNISSVKLQKLKSQLDKIQFYFDDATVKEAVQQAFNQAMPVMQFRQTHTPDVQRQIEIKRVIEKKIMQHSLQVLLPARSRSKSRFCADSAAAAELEMVYEKMHTNTDPLIIPAPPNPPANGKKTFRKQLNYYTCSYGFGSNNLPPVNVAPVINYKITAGKNVYQKINIPKPGIRKRKISVECKDGKIYINGNEITIQDNDEVVALSLRAKKLSAKVKDIEINLND